MATVVQLKNIRKMYSLGNTLVPALKQVNLAVREGDFVAVAGPSGAGKSTLLNIIGLIDTPSEGEVFLFGQPVSCLSDRELTRLRHRSLGFIFQSFNLIPVLNVFENVELPLLLGNRPSGSERRERVNTLLKEVGLSRWQRHKPAELSGGQRQRVAVARALVTRPAIVIADEPTANLDSETGSAILGLMESMNREMNTTFVFSTHDEQIRKMARHVVMLKDGLVQSEEQF